MGDHYHACFVVKLRLEERLVNDDAVGIVESDPPRFSIVLESQGAKCNSLGQRPRSSKVLILEALTARNEGCLSSWKTNPLGFVSRLQRALAVKSCGAETTAYLAAA